MAKLSRSKRLPMYFKGQQQSEKFAHGAWAAGDLVAKLQAHDPAKWSSEQVTAALADKFSDNVAKGGDYSRGFVTAMVECLAFVHCVGSPNFAVWRPLEMELRYTTRRAHPTQGSTLYQLDDSAVSVAPDLAIHEWFGDDGNRIERSAAFLARVQKHGVPISQRKFDALRKVGVISQAENAPNVKALAAAVARMHGSPVRFVGSVPVHKHLEGATVWKGIVSRFELPGHPATTFCYAWSVPATDDSKERFYTVLHTPRIDSAEKAVRASIIADKRRNNTQASAAAN